MLKQLKFASLITLSALTVACGSGGSGSATTPDGTKVNLTNSAKGLIGGQTDDGNLIGYNQNYSFYGTWVNTDKTQYETRYQGTETPVSRLPQGSATYKGHAVRARDNVLAGTTAGIQTNGVSTLNVNFDTKKVSGLIEMPLARDITLHETNLNGNKFSGQASVLLNRNGTYEGGLFGPNAEEAAGIVKFTDDDALTTSFGGSR